MSDGRHVYASQCPYCDSTRIGQIDQVPGVALAQCSDADGNVTAWTRWTELNRDSQRPAEDAPRLSCLDCQKEFVSPLLRLVHQGRQ